jgi:hypothetical protein
MKKLIVIILMFISSILISFSSNEVFGVKLGMQFSNVETIMHNYILLNKVSNIAFIYRANIFGVPCVVCITGDTKIVTGVNINIKSEDMGAMFLSVKNNIINKLGNASTIEDNILLWSFESSAIILSKTPTYVSIFFFLGDKKDQKLYLKFIK